MGQNPEDAATVGHNGKIDREATGEVSKAVNFGVV